MPRRTDSLSNIFLDLTQLVSSEYLISVIMLRGLGNLFLDSLLNIFLSNDQSPFVVSGDLGLLNFHRLAIGMQLQDGSA
jgi:hypothetical protein